MRDRPYQTESIDAIATALQENQSTLLVLPTGCGKTHVFGRVIQRMPEGRAMVLAHREELINQASSRIAAITGAEPDIEMADLRADKGMWKSRVVVSSIQTQIAGKTPRMSRFNPGDFGLVVVDEAHHATSPSYRKVIDHYRKNPRCKVLGVTATPDRADEQALGQIFQSVAYVYEVSDAIKDGWLVPIEQKSVTVKGLDYSTARVTAGDLNAADIARAQRSETVLHGIVDPIIALANGRRGIVFATPGFAGDEGDEFHVAERLTEIFNRHKPGCAERVSQDTPRDQRKSMLKRFANGDIQFMVNVGVLTEGFDDPGIEVVAVARPTKSRALYAQMIGRGTRPLPGIIDGIPYADGRRSAIAASTKPRVTVIDLNGNAGRHKLIHAADVLGGNETEDVVARANKKLEKAGGGDVQEAIDAVKREIEDERERERRKHVVAKTTFSVEDVDPLNVLNLPPVPLRGWDTSNPPSDKQLALLDRFGVPRSRVQSKRQASAIIDSLLRRQQEGQVDYRTAARLKAQGAPSNITVGQHLNRMFAGSRA